MTKGPSGPQQSVSGVYNASTISLADGQQAPHQLDANGKLLVNAGTITASLGGFAPSGTYTTPLSVSNVSANTAINGADPVQSITNTGSVTAYVNLGTTNAITATTSDIAIAAGATVPLTVGSNTYLAAITSTGSTTLNIAGGSGLLTGIAGSPSVSGSNPAAGSTGSAVPSSASYDGLNVGGTLRGHTGVNPSGSVYAGQTDLTSVGGTTLAFGQATMAASIPVVIASNQSAISASINQATPGTTNLVDASNFAVTQDQNAGAAGASTLRVVLATGGATIAASQSGTWTVGISASQSIAVTQATASSLNATVSIAAAQTLATVTTVGAVTAITNALPAGTNSIGAVTGIWEAATGSAVPANGVYTGLLAKTSNPTAASDGNLVGAMADKLGRQVTVIGNVRDNKASAVITLSSTTSTTLVTGIASVYNDIYGLIAANKSATAVTLTLSSSSGATPFPIEIPANDTRGFMLPSSDGLKQNTVNTNWTAALSAGSITVGVTAMYVKNS